MEIKDMKEIGKMVYLKEKEQNIMRMEIKNLREIGKMVFMKEKEYYII